VAIRTYRAEGYRTQQEFVTGINATPVMVRPYNSRRLAVALSFVPASGSSEINVQIGGRVHGVLFQQKFTDISRFRTHVLRYDDYAGIIWGEIWASSSGFTGLLTLVEYIRD